MANKIKYWSENLDVGFLKSSLYWNVDVIHLFLLLNQHRTRHTNSGSTFPAVFHLCAPSPGKWHWRHNILTLSNSFKRLSNISNALKDLLDFKVVFLKSRASKGSFYSISQLLLILKWATKHTFSNFLVNLLSTEQRHRENTFLHITHLCKKKVFQMCLLLFPFQVTHEPWVKKSRSCLGTWFEGGKHQINSIFWKKKIRKISLLVIHGFSFVSILV